MSITVKDTLTIGGLQKGKIIAGFNGISNIVENINVLEISDFSPFKKIPHWIVKNELYISALFSIKSDVTKQIEMVKKLSEKEVAGLVLCHFGKSLKTISEDFIEICNKLDFPLILVPSEMRYSEILIPVMDTILKKNTTKLKFSIEVQEKLDTLILENNSIHDLCSAITEMTNCSIIFFDMNNTTLSSSGFSENMITNLEEYCQKNFQDIYKDYSRPNKIFRTISDKEYLIHPILSGPSYYGLIIIETSNIDIEILSMAIHQAGIAFALLITKSKRIDAVKDSYFRDFLGDLITWNFKDVENAQLRAESLGWDIRKFTLQLIINIDSIVDINKTISPETTGYIKRNLLGGVSVLIKNENINNRIGLRSDMILVFLADTENEENIFKKAGNLSKKIIQHVRKQKKIEITVGISNIINQPSEIERAYKEAAYAIQLGRKFMGSFHYFEYRQVEYIAELKKAVQYNMSSEKLLAPILEYDKKHNINLLNTMEKLFKYQFDTVTVADMMNLHRNTILYRKNKIIRILNYNPFVHPYKLNFEIAFLLLDI